MPLPSYLIRWEETFIALVCGQYISPYHTHFMQTGFTCLGETSDQEREEYSDTDAGQEQ